MSISCDIVILPNRELASNAIDASKKLARLNSIFTLQQGKYFPHASLYMTQLDDKNLDTVKEALGVMASDLSGFNLEPSGYLQNQGYVDVGYEVTDGLDQLQRKVIEAVQPLSGGMREKDKERMKEATGLALQNFQNYGYKYVGELFRPHITFTRFDSEQPTAIALLPDLAIFNGMFDRLGLFEMGDNGTCVREIASWELQ